MDGLTLPSTTRTPRGPSTISWTTAPRQTSEWRARFTWGRRGTLISNSETRRCTGAATHSLSDRIRATTPTLAIRPRQWVAEEAADQRPCPRRAVVRGHLLEP